MKSQLQLMIDAERAGRPAPPPSADFGIPNRTGQPGHMPWCIYAFPCPTCMHKFVCHESHPVIRRADVCNDKCSGRTAPQPERRDV